jgi:hypothetical protein
MHLPRHPFSIDRRPSRPLAAVAFAGATALALLAGPAAAQEPVPEPANGLLGLWHRNDVSAVRIETDRLVHIFEDRQWVESADRCTVVFEHAFGTATRAEVMAEYDTPDFADPEGRPLADRLASLLPEEGGPFATLQSACCCPTEIPGSARYVLLDEDTVLAIRYGDGVYALDTLHASVPPPR